MISNPTFWLALCVLVPTYWLTPARCRVVLMAAASFAFLASLQPMHTVLLAGWSFLIYHAAPRSDSKIGRIRLTALMLGVLGYLAFYKYLPPEWFSRNTDSWAVPLGISYFTFRLIHYAIEVSRGTIPRHSALAFLNYILFFPVFSAGPIERFDHFMGSDNTAWQSGHLVIGLTRVIHGLIKKFVCVELVIKAFLLSSADTFLYVERIPDFPVWKVWAYCGILFCMLYLEFSAYSDIAIGASRLFGIRIAENFNWPMVARNVSDFWRRWHMSMVGWCRAYVYLPVIGYTRSPYVASFLTCIAIGLWHAGSWNFVAWGVYHAVGVLVFQCWSRLVRSHRWEFVNRLWWSAIARPLTLAFMTASFAFTMTHDHGGLPAAGRVLAKLVAIDVDNHSIPETEIATTNNE